MRIQDFSKEERIEISEIYKNNVSKMRSTIAITKKRFSKQIEAGTLTCPVCGKKIERISVIHAKIHERVNEGSGIYWKEGNLVPMCSQECHSMDEFETYRTSTGKDLIFSKFETGKNYREVLKNPEMD